MSRFRAIERGRIKCGQYWPAENEAIEQYGNFAVVNNGVEIHEDYCVTTLHLQNLDVIIFIKKILNLQILPEPRCCYQTAWSDKPPIFDPFGISMSDLSIVNGTATVTDASVVTVAH